MKRIISLLLVLCVLLSAVGCAAKPEGSVDVRPVQEFAEECLETKMAAEGVKLYTVHETETAGRTGENVFEVKFVYAENGGEKQTYLYRIRLDGEACTLLAEGETLPYQTAD